MDLINRSKHKPDPLHLAYCPANGQQLLQHKVTGLPEELADAAPLILTLMLIATGKPDVTNQDLKEDLQSMNATCVLSNCCKCP